MGETMDDDSSFGNDAFNRERLDRIEALNHAVHSKQTHDSADAVVKIAQKYFEFLQGRAPQN